MEKIYIILTIFLVILIGCQQEDYSHITTFEQCVDAGFPVMESYPRQCNTPDGRNFVEEIEEQEQESSGSNVQELPEPTLEYDFVESKLITEDSNFTYPIGYGRYNFIINVNQPVDVRLYNRNHFYKYKDNKSGSTRFDINVGENQEVTIEFYLIEGFNEINVSYSINQESSFE